MHSTWPCRTMPDQGAPAGTIVVLTGCASQDVEHLVDWPGRTMPDQGVPAGTIVVLTGCASQDVEHLVDRPGRIAPAGGDADDAVEEAVLLRRRLEPRRGAEVVLVGVDALALVELLDHPT